MCRAIQTFQIAKGVVAIYRFKSLHERKNLEQFRDRYVVAPFQNGERSNFVNEAVFVTFFDHVVRVEQKHTFWSEMNGVS